MNGGGYSDSAIVKELLDETNGMKNIQQLRKKLLREKTLVDSQLQAGIKQETKTLADNIQVLRKLRSTVGGAKHSLGDMDQLYAESVAHVPGFDDTQSVATMLSNFDLTQKFVAHFEGFELQTKQVGQLMESDGDYDLENKMPNLVPVHYMLNQLRVVREEATRYLSMKDATSDTRLTLKRLYEPLDYLVERFDYTLTQIGENLLETLRSGNSSLVVRAAKIIEFEERQDIIAQLSNEGQKKCKGLSQFGQSAGVSSSRYGHREPRRYLEQFFKSIESSIRAQFDFCMSEFSPDTNTEALLAELDFVYSELQGAKEDLMQCCPERWQIFQKFVHWYHQGVHRTLEAIMRFETPPGLKLVILEYVKQYYRTMSDVFGVSRKKTPELLQPPLLDGRERELYDDYLEHLVSNLRKWYGTIWDNQKEEFEKGTFQPEFIEDGPGLKEFLLVTKLIAQQLEVAGESKQARLIAGCVDTCCDVIVEYQRKCVQLIRTATRKSIHEEPDAPNGTFEYLFLIANDQDRSYTFLENLSAKWSAPMPPRYQGKVISKFTEAQEGYQEVTKECFLQSLQFIYSDTRSAFSDVFSSEKWYSGLTMTEIIDTYEDYVGDTKKILLKDLFDIFLGKLCTETILWYLRAMIVPSGDKPRKINMPRGKERIRDDATRLHAFFTREEFGLDNDATNDAFFVFKILCNVLEAPSLDELPELFRELRSNERDAPLDLFEAMVNLRKDVDARSLRDIMVNVRSEIVHKEPAAAEVEDQEDLGHSFLYDFNKVE